MREFEHEHLAFGGGGGCTHNLGFMCVCPQQLSVLFVEGGAALRFFRIYVGLVTHKFGVQRPTYLPTYPPAPASVRKTYLPTYLIFRYFTK